MACGASSPAPTLVAPATVARCPARAGRRPAAKQDPWQACTYVSRYVSRTGQGRSLAGHGRAARWGGTLDGAVSLGTAYAAASGGPFQAQLRAHPTIQTYRWRAQPPAWCKDSTSTTQASV